jgi:Clostripain family
LSNKVKSQSKNPSQTEKNEMAKWTVLIYFAADNDLDEEALANLKMMKKAGSTEEVKIVAQLDSRGRGSTFRFLLQDERSSLDEDVVGEPLPEVNTGDPRELTDFIKWGMKEYPAQHTMLVLWGHGRGWENQDNAVRAAPLATDIIIHKNQKGDELQGWSIARTNGREIRRFLRAGGDGVETMRLNNMLDSGGQFTCQYAGRYAGKYFPAGQFKDSENEAVVGFLTDQTPGEALESSQDVLRMDELSSALEKALDGKTKRKIDILGMDACLMGMMEVGYQVKESVNYLVATEDTIPDDGWPYDRILARLVECPDLSPEDFSATIVREYLIHYRELEKDVAKSVCNLKQSQSLVSALKELATELKNKLSDDNVRVAVLGARVMAQSFYIRDYVDLYHFCSKLQGLCPDKKVKSGCAKVMNAIRHSTTEDGESQNPSQGHDAKKDFVYEYGFIGHRLRESNGVSIYFPCTNPSLKYTELPFAKDSGWSDFLKKLAGLFPERVYSGESDASDGASGIESAEELVDDIGIKAGQGTAEKIVQGTVQRVPPIRRRDCSSSEPRQMGSKIPSS